MSEQRPSRGEDRSAWQRRRHVSSAEGRTEADSAEEAGVEEAGAEAVPGYWPHVVYDVRARTLRAAREATKARARDLRGLLTRHVRRHWPQAEPPARATPAPPRATGSYARLLPLLRLIPWALAALFAVSFAWDFPGITLTLLGYELALDGLLRITSVSGLIGFVTNWLAITMLFQPREARPIFGQGLIPAQRERVIFRLARAVSEDLINEDIIKAKIEASGIIPKYRERVLQMTHSVLEDPDFRQQLKALTADYAQEVLISEPVQRRIVAFTIERMERHAERGLGGLALKAYRFLNEDDFRRRIQEAARALPESVDVALDEADHVLDHVPARLEAHADDLERWATRAVLRFVENLDVYQMIYANMQQYDEQQLEDLLKKTSNEQLNYIKYLGGILGLVGGLVIWNAPLALAVFGVLGLVLYALDEALFRMRG